MTAALDRLDPERMTVEHLVAEVVYLRDENDRLVRIIAEDTCRLLAYERNSVAPLRVAA